MTGKKERSSKLWSLNNLRNIHKLLRSGIGVIMCHRNWIIITFKSRCFGNAIKSTKNNRVGWQINFRPSSASFTLLLLLWTWKSFGCLPLNIIKMTTVGKKLGFENDYPQIGSLEGNNWGLPWPFWRWSEPSFVV